MTAPLTPRQRVEAAEIEVFGNDDEYVGNFVNVDFARQLAAELEELQKKCDRLTGMKFSDRMHAALASRAKAAQQREASARTDRDSLHKEWEAHFGKASFGEVLLRLADAERRLAATQPNNPCTCVPDGDDGSVAHLCEWHKHQFGKAYRMQNVADTLTVENILKLPQDALRRWIAHGIQESSARKKSEEQLARYREKYGELE